MVIQYYGLSQVKVSVGDKTLIFAPYSREVGTKNGLKSGAMGSDIVLVPVNDPAYNAVDQATYGDKEPFVVSGPGEYEIGGTFIQGFSSTGPDNRINTIYSVYFDDINVCHLGALVDTKLEPETKEALGEIDVLLLPTYGSVYRGLIDESAASSIASGSTAKVIVPLYTAGDKVKGGSTLTGFLKEYGESNGKPEEKFTFKKKDIESKEGEICVLSTN